MGLTELLRKAVLGLTLAAGATSCSETTSPKYVQYEKKTTNQQGQVSLGEGATVRVQDENTQAPLENMVVHYLHTDNENTVLALDPQRNYYPGITSFASGSGEATERRRRKDKLIAIGLEKFAAGIGAGKVILETINMPPGEVLGEDENVTRYCLSMEEIITRTIEIPAGIIFIAPKLVYGQAADIVKIAITTTLKDIVEMYVVDEYGLQLGYEVHVPKTAVTNFCDEESKEVVCDISGDNLLGKLWSGELPYWQIVGGCEPGGKGNGNNGEECHYQSHTREDCNLFCEVFDGCYYEIGDEVSGVWVGTFNPETHLQECKEGCQTCDIGESNVECAIKNQEINKESCHKLIDCMYK